MVLNDLDYYLQPVHQEQETRLGQAFMKLFTQRSINQQQALSQKLELHDAAVNLDMGREVEHPA